MFSGRHRQYSDSGQAVGAGSDTGRQKPTGYSAELLAAAGAFISSSTTRRVSVCVVQDGVKQPVEVHTEQFTQVKGETAGDRFTRLVDAHGVPENLHFVLATLARRSCSSDPVPSSLAIHCLALSVLIESSPSDQTFVDSIFLHCPRLIEDCFALVAPAEGTEISTAVQMAATYTLTALNQERSRQTVLVASAGISEVC